MGIFYSAQQAVLPAIRDELSDALRQPQQAENEAHQNASTRAITLAQATSLTFNVWRFVAAAVIAAILLGAAIGTAKDMPDISKVLMTSFSSFSGIVVGLLGGEAQKSLN